MIQAKYKISIVISLVCLISRKNSGIISKESKLVGRDGNIHQLWVWRYGFSRYTTGRVWRLTVLW